MFRDAGPQVTWVVEEDGYCWGAGDTLRKAFLSACVTLSLGCLGSSILPVPFALSKTGVLVGALTMVVVAWANDSTSCMLIRAAAATGKPTYEALAEWAGGKPWKVFTQVTLVLLLWGTMCGGLALISDVAVIMVEQGFAGAEVPPWLNGRTCMTAMALLVLYPLCLQRHMRELETAATCGVAMVVLMIALVAFKAWQAGFPAIASGELPLWSLHVDGQLPEAFAVVGYAFYMQPMMMPLLKEMPPVPGAVQAMEWAVHITLYGVAFFIYFGMGVFGAALFGQHTQGNIMVNHIVTGQLPCLLLYGAMLVYLSLAMTTTQYALRATLDLLVAGEDAPFTWARQVTLTSISVGFSLAVALLFPSAAEKIYAVVGATAVCVVCYVIPVYIQLVMYSRQREAAKAVGVQGSDGLLTAPLLRHVAMDLEGATATAAAAAGAAGALSASGPESAEHLQPPAQHLSQRHGPPCRHHDLPHHHQHQHHQHQHQQQVQHESRLTGCSSSSCSTGGVNQLQQGHRRKLCSSVLYVDGSPWEVMQQVVLPILILLMGLGFSVAALYVSLLPWWENSKQ